MAGCGLRELREIVGGGGSRRQEPRSQLWATGQARPRLRGRHSGRLPPAPPRGGRAPRGLPQWGAEVGAGAPGRIQTRLQDAGPAC